MRIVTLAAALALLAATAAQAALHPKYYEEARRNAPHVVVIQVRKMVAPAGSLGQCRMHGAVTAVERGARYRLGQAIVVAVPCVAPGAHPPSSGVLYQEQQVLKRSRTGRAFLLESGELALYQYEVLS
ncbi:MAG TPA: hypothetical protein VEA44_00605 [Caulobacter sp.]|nr:hypothetical protein [Caulobacter sp.]